MARSIVRQRVDAHAGITGGRRHPRGGRLAVSVALLLAFATSCGGGILGSDPSTGLLVQVRKGPIEPVVREGEEDNSAPVPDAVVEVRAVGRSGEARVRTDGAGEARVPLEPGRYVVEVAICPLALGLPGPETATVVAGSLTPVRLECDTGIR